MRSEGIRGGKRGGTSGGREGEEARRTGAAVGADVEQLAQTRPGQAVAAHGMLVVSSRNAVARSVGQDARQARGSEGRVARISRRQAADGRGCQLPGIQSLRGGLGRDAGGGFQGRAFAAARRRRSRDGRVAATLGPWSWRGGRAKGDVAAEVSCGALRWGETAS